MHFVVWITVGLITGWVIRQLLGEDGYGPIVNSVVAIAGSIGGGLIVRFGSPSAGSGLVHTALAALLGAAILTGFTILVIGQRRLV